MPEKHPESLQTEEFVQQSLRYVLKDQIDVADETSYISEHSLLKAAAPTRILDVGCGPGYVLKSVVDAFPGSTGVGVEPSQEAVRRLDEIHQSCGRLEFVVGAAHDLPFPTDSFDLVICWSVLHWIGRNEYLQSLGEVIRVTRRHLVVMDFAAARDYRTPYRYDERYFTYKADFVAPILASGVMSVADDLRWILTPDGVRHAIGRADLEPFLGKAANYTARRATLFLKNYALMPVQTESDFL
ncbi:MAG: class I SAM-dependent methyltransferase [Actinomycetota bacterium]|nr:class I SAM-dependent methyltransferase [Actinomycetota bacterium]